MNAIRPEQAAEQLAALGEIYKPFVEDSIQGFTSLVVPDAFMALLKSVGVDVPEVVAFRRYVSRHHHHRPERVFRDVDVSMYECAPGRMAISDHYFGLFLQEMALAEAGRSPQICVPEAGNRLLTVCWGTEPPPVIQTVDAAHHFRNSLEYRGVTIHIIYYYYDETVLNLRACRRAQPPRDLAALHIAVGNWGPAFNYNNLRVYHENGVAINMNRDTVMRIEPHGSTTTATPRYVNVPMFLEDVAGRQEDHLAQDEFELLLRIQNDIMELKIMPSIASHLRHQLRQEALQYVPMHFSCPFLGVQRDDEQCIHWISYLILLQYLNPTWDVGALNNFAAMRRTPQANDEFIERFITFVETVVQVKFRHQLSENLRAPLPPLRYDYRTVDVPLPRAP